MIEIGGFSFSVTEMVTGLSGIATIVILAWNKMKDVKSPAIKEAQEDILSHVRAEKDFAVKQRDMKIREYEELCQINKTLEMQLREVRDEVDNMKRRVMLLTELNRRLALNLDHAKNSIEEYLDWKKNAGICGFSDTLGVEEADAKAESNELGE